jgi:recyclin-1
MNHYFGFIQSMKNENLLLYFTALRELSQVYLIRAEDAKDMAAVIADVDRFHGILRAEEVYEFAERRADWYQVKGNVERAMFGVGCTVM